MTSVPSKQAMRMPGGKAGSPPLDTLNYPVLASIKYDGVFVMIYDGQIYTRALKEVGNRHIREHFNDLIAKAKKHDMVITGELYHPDLTFGQAISAIRAHEGDLTGMEIYIFDCIKREDFDKDKPEDPYRLRNAYARRFVDCEHTDVVEQTFLDCEKDLAAFIVTAYANDEEGVVVRDAEGTYKHGQCTQREQNMFRYKALERKEVYIVKVLEGKKLKKTAKKKRRLDGVAERSSKKEDYEPAFTAGSIKVKDENDDEFMVGFGEGWNDKSKREMWKNRNAYVDKVLEIEYNPYNVKDVPRQPKAVRLRHDKTKEDVCTKN